MVATTDFERVLSFYLGQLDEHGLAASETSKKWWKKDDAFDRSIREQFEADYEAIVAGEREDWLATPRGRVAYIVVLDQLARNMFRGTAKMYAADDRALKAALEGLELGIDDQLATDERVFLYMPLMHCESVEQQNRCVDLFAAFRDECTGPARDRITSNHKFAVWHRDIVADWGRFPHRNEILGRDSTPEEREFLKKPGSGF